jgi:stage III sporulation protein AF
MTEIADWIKKIIAVLILAGFLEMILPNNELKGVTKMMIGLLIILIIVQPLFKIFNLPTTILNSVSGVVEADTSGNGLPATRRIIKEGLAIRNGWTLDIQKRNQEILTEKIKTSIGLIDGVKLLDVKMEFHNLPTSSTVFSGTTDLTGYGGLKKIKLRVRFTDSGSGRQFSLASFQREKRLVERRIRDTIQLFSNLTDDQIEVIWDE